MELVLLLGRVLFALIFLNSGIGHLRQRAGMTGYAKSKKVPAAGAAVVISGLMLILGALGIALGIYADLAALLLVIFLVPTAFLMHNFWTVSDPMAKMSETVNFFKDLSLAGAALMIMVFVGSSHHLDGFTFGPIVGDMLNYFNF